METIDLEEALATAMLENQWLENRVADLTDQVETLLAEARRASQKTNVVGANWSREQDHTGAA